MRILASLRNAWMNLTRVEEPVYWFARGPSGHRFGTFRSELEAWEAVMDATTGEPVAGAIVWCESVAENRGWLRAREAMQSRSEVPLDDA